MYLSFCDFIHRSSDSYSVQKTDGQCINKTRTQYVGLIKKKNAIVIPENRMKHSVEEQQPNSVFEL